MTFADLEELWMHQGAAGILATDRATLLIPLEPWGSSRVANLSDSSSTVGLPPIAIRLTGTKELIGPRRTVVTRVGERYVVPRLEVRALRKSDRNAYAHIAVGRSANNDVVIDQASVSRFHADLRLIEGVYCIRDAKSRNGTRLNGTLLRSPQGEPIRSGDVIGFGEASCVFCVVSDSDLRVLFGASHTNAQAAQPSRF